MKLVTAPSALTPLGLQLKRHLGRLEKMPLFAFSLFTVSLKSDTCHSGTNASTMAPCLCFQRVYCELQSQWPVKTEKKPSLT